MSGSSLDGLDIALVHLQETAGKWAYEIIKADCYEYEDEWKNKLQNAVDLNALEYQLLHADYGHFIGKKINFFIEENNLQHKVDLVASHGHTTFHYPHQQMTHQIGNGAAIAAETKLPVVSDLRELDVAFGGEGAPIVPIGEKLLFSEFDIYLNIGGIANISVKDDDEYIAFDICAANRVLNMLANEKSAAFDEDGKLAAAGNINDELLSKLNSVEYYKLPHPKSLANSFGTDVVYPLIKKFNITTEDALRTYAEHIVQQIHQSILNLQLSTGNSKLLVTGGGAFNKFLIKRLQEILQQLKIEIVIPEEIVIKYKEALIMALIGVLRWREEYNVLASVTGAQRNSIGGALWLGTEA